MYFRVLRHRHESSPGMMDVGGPFFDFGAVRTESHDANRCCEDGVVPRPPRRRRHDHASVRASRARVEATPRRRDAIDATVRVIQRRRTSPNP